MSLILTILCKNYPALLFPGQGIRSELTVLSFYIT